MMCRCDLESVNVQEVPDFKFLQSWRLLLFELRSISSDEMIYIISLLKAMEESKPPDVHSKDN